MPLAIFALRQSAQPPPAPSLEMPTPLDQSSLSRNLHALERDGMVEIAIVESDQRKRAVWLTERGAQRLEAAMPVWRSAHAALAARLEPELAWLAQRTKLSRARARPVPATRRIT